MASDLNNVFVVGRMVGEPEMVVDKDDLKIIAFSIANNRVSSKKEIVSFFNCQAFGKLASVIKQYCHKGDRVGINGRLQQKTWQKKDGSRGYDVCIMVQEIQFLSGSKQGQKENQTDFENIESANDVFGDINF